MVKLLQRSIKTNGIKKKDGSSITPFQIQGRTKYYSQLFHRSGVTVSLIDRTTIKPTKPLPKAVQTPGKPSQKTIITKQVKSSLLEKQLMNSKLYRSAAVVDGTVSHGPGLYCIRIKDKTKLPAPFNKLLTERSHNIIYIGIASTSLSSRFLNQELRANGHGTFFRSIGAVLGYRPTKGSLINKANKRNYKFSPVDETKIIEWINKNLVVNWVECDKEFDTIETDLLYKHRPLLNIAKNPSALAHLSKLRAECVRIANSH